MSCKIGELVGRHIGVYLITPRAPRRSSKCVERKIKRGHRGYRLSHVAYTHIKDPDALRKIHVVTFLAAGKFTPQWFTQRSLSMSVFIHERAAAASNITAQVKRLLNNTSLGCLPLLSGLLLAHHSQSLVLYA